MLLQRVYALARHPNPFKRLGAMLTLARVYREFRESDMLVRAHTLELLDHALACLRLAHNDADALETAQRASEVVAALKKIVADASKQKWRLLLVPTVVTQGHCRDLHAFSHWLVEQLIAPETEYRRRCADLLETFVPLLVQSSGNKEQTSGKVRRLFSPCIFFSHNKRLSVYC